MMSKKTHETHAAKPHELHEEAPREPANADLPQNAITKLEWFAGMALQGLCTDNRFSAEEAVKRSVSVARALLAELEKPEPKQEAS